MKKNNSSLFELGPPVLAGDDYGNWGLVIMVLKLMKSELH